MRVSVLGFGASEIGYTPITDHDLSRLLDEALDAGINVVDTAECYRASEEDLGRVLSGRRDRLYLVSKCGHNRGLEPLENWTPALLEASIDRSLRRLRTEYLDVLLLHSCATAILQHGAVIDVLERARDAGKARSIGYSGDGQAAVYAIQTGRFDVLETSVNLADQESIDLTLPLASQHDMGVIAKRPLANVAWANITPPERVIYWPSGYIDSYRERLQQLDYSFLQGDLQHAVSIALRFTLGCTGVSTAIIGTRRPERLRQNALYAQDGPLDQDQLAAIRARWHAVATPEWVGTN
jgi:aryl-alcohol dehydrogenase-like predicted oxidoreductase